MKEFMHLSTLKLMLYREKKDLALTAVSAFGESTELSDCTSSSAKNMCYCQALRRITQHHKKRGGCLWKHTMFLSYL